AVRRHQALRRQCARPVCRGEDQDFLGERVPRLSQAEGHHRQTGEGGIAVSPYWITLTLIRPTKASTRRFIMSIQALGYIGVRAKDIGDWGSYGTTMLGLQRVDKPRSSLAFRMDDRKQRLVVEADGGQGIAYFGWEVVDAAALDAFAARMEAAGIAV